MGKFKQFISEVYHVGFTRRMYGKENHADVYKNPTHKELHTTTNNDGNTLAWLHHEHMYSFHPQQTRHLDTKEHAGINPHDSHHEGISLDIHHDKKEAHVMVTDSTKGKWRHNPDIKHHIQSHPELKKHFKKIHVSYHDEDIHGDWHKMKKED